MTEEEKSQLRDDVAELREIADVLLDAGPNGVILGKDDSERIYRVCEAVVDVVGEPCL